MCDKGDIDKGNYEMDLENHGAFMIGCNGSTWSKTNKDLNNKVLGITFRQGDLVKCKFSPSEKIITYTNLTSNKSYKLPFEGENLSVCVLFHFKGTVVDILSEG